MLRAPNSFKTALRLQIPIIKILNQTNLPNTSCQEKLVVIFERSEDRFAEETIRQHTSGKDVNHGTDPEGERMFSGELNGT